MRLQPIPDNQQRLLEVGFERLQEFDDLLFLDASLVQTEQAVGASQPGYDRDMIPVEVELNDRRASLGMPKCARVSDAR